jgi:thiol-disulfide isomerase/thioredoxin
MNRIERSTLTRGAFLAGAGVALLGGCSRDHRLSWPSPGSGPATTSAPTMSATPLASMQDATSIDGTPFSPASLAGRPIVLWFWAPWCFVCRSEAPNVNIAVNHEAGLATFIGVAGLGQAHDMRSFVHSTHTEGIVHLADTDGSIWNAFGIVAQPSFAFITADRRISTYTGSLGASNLIAKVDALLDA